MKAEVDALRARLTGIAKSIATASGAPVADSAASRAVALLDGSAKGVKTAADELAAGLN